MPRVLSAPAQLVPESNQTSMVSMRFSYSEAWSRIDGGSKSATGAVQKTSDPVACAPTSAAMCSTLSSVTSGSPVSV